MVALPGGFTGSTPTGGLVIGVTPGGLLAGWVEPPFFVLFLLPLDEDHLRVDGRCSMTSGIGISGDVVSTWGWVTSMAHDAHDISVGSCSGTACEREEAAKIK